jgi:hypothetical protein
MLPHGSAERATDDEPAFVAAEFLRAGRPRSSAKNRPTSTRNRRQRATSGLYSHDPSTDCGSERCFGRFCRRCPRSTNSGWSCPNLPKAHASASSRPLHRCDSGSVWPKVRHFTTYSASFSIGLSLPALAGRRFAILARLPGSGSSAATAGTPILNRRGGIAFGQLPKRRRLVVAPIRGAPTPL